MPYKVLNKLKEKIKQKLNACKVVSILLISDRYKILAQKRKRREEVMKSMQS